MSLGWRGPRARWPAGCVHGLAGEDSRNPRRALAAVAAGEDVGARGAVTEVGAGAAGEGVVAVAAA